MVSYVKPPSYEGREPYIFISYAHKDDAMVLPTIVALQRAGYRVWYDAGIQVGTEWPENIARHLLRSTLAIAFISQNAVASDHCRQEITYAISKKVPMLTVRLDDAPMPPGVEMQLNLRQTLNAYLHPNLESFIGELVGASYIKEVFAAAATRAPQPPRNDESIAAPSSRTPTKPLSAEDLKLRGKATKAYGEAMEHLRCHTADGYRRAIEIYNADIHREGPGSAAVADLQKRFCDAVFDEAMSLPANSSMAKHLFGALPDFYRRREDDHRAVEYAELIEKRQKKFARWTMILTGLLLILLNVLVYRFAFSLTDFWLVRALFACFPMLVCGIIGGVIGRMAPDRDYAFIVLMVFFFLSVPVSMVCMPVTAVWLKILLGLAYNVVPFFIFAVAVPYDSKEFDVPAIKK
ncbi:MAG: toll/interleukin-1 receptor domain-containing protein [Clostridia bacterium]|nr:toll/interleukin-1 receptor domain-containing protein [Clostridia bacterium]